MDNTIKHKTKEAAYWQFFNQFSNYGMQFIIGIVLARILTPEDFGITALPAVFYAIAGIFIDSGFGAAMVRKPELTEKDLSTAFYYSTAVGFLLYVALFVCAPCIASFFDIPILSSLIRIAALSFLFSGFLTPQNIILNRKLDFKIPTIVSIISKSFMGLIGITIAYLGYGVWALVISSVSSSFLTVLVTWLFVRWYPKSGWSKDSFNYLWTFGNKMIATLLIDRIYLNIVPVVIGKFYSTAQLGEYNRAQGYAQLPAQEFTNLLHSVTYPVMSKMQDDIDYLRNSYRRMLRLCAYIVFPIMLLMAVLAKPLIILLITEKWISCVLYLQLMCITMMWYPIYSINLALLLVKGRSDLFLRLEIIKVAIGLIIMGLTLPFGIVNFLIGNFFNSLICLYVNTYYAKKIIDVGFIRQTMDMTPVLLLSLIMAGISYMVMSFFSNYFLQLIFGGTVGIIMYSISSYLLKFPEFEDAKYMLSRKQFK